jgi:hypothetical protein
MGGARQIIHLPFPWFLNPEIIMAAIKITGNEGGCCCITSYPINVHHCIMSDSVSQECAWRLGWVVYLVLMVLRLLSWQMTGLEGP